MGLHIPSGGFTDGFDVVVHILQRGGIEREKLWRPPQPGQRPLDFARRHRADVAETLRDDEVRIQPAQQRLVDPVQAAPVLECVPDLPVDGRTAGLLRVHGTADDHGLVPDFRGVVAFVADGHEVVHQAEGGHDFRGPGEQ